MGMAVGGTSTTKSDPNVVPLIDILLVLLVIFMVISPSAQKGIDLKLPETVAGGDQGPSNVIVLSLKGDGTVMINQENVQSSDLLGPRLREIYSTRQDKTIFIRANSKLPYKDVVKVIDTAKSVGIDVIGIVPEIYEE